MFAGRELDTFIASRYCGIADRNLAASATIGGKKKKRMKDSRPKTKTYIKSAATNRGTRYRMQNAIPGSIAEAMTMAVSTRSARSRRSQKIYAPTIINSVAMTVPGVIETRISLSIIGILAYRRQNCGRDRRHER